MNPRHPTDRPEAGGRCEPPAGPAPSLVATPARDPAVPRQVQGGEATALAAAGHGRRTGPPAPGGDPLQDPDPAAAADAAAAGNLLRCWVRERGVGRPDGPALRIPLPSSGMALSVPVRYWSATGGHLFGTPRLDPGGPESPQADAVTLAVLFARESAHGAGPGAVTDLVGRVADSVRRTAGFLAARRAAPAPVPGADLFLGAEQDLVLGHPLHPAPKSREGVTGHEARRYSPELRGGFPLHWFAVDRSVLAADSAWTEQGRVVPAGRLAARLAGEGIAVPRGAVPLPLHPWQAREAVHRPSVARLLAAGLLHDLGEHGPPWHPTSSVRTVLRPGAPAMLKLSLGLSITNSRRENLRKEMHRGVEVHRLLRAGLGRRWREAFSDGPPFDIVRDAAWLGVDDTEGEPVPGLDTLVRHNPFGPRDDVCCVASLTSPRPWPGDPSGALRSRLAHVIGDLAGRTGRPVPAVAAEWFLRYLRTVVRPVLRLDGVAGIALEAHQQNTLVRLDAEGWPAGGWYRDNQGFYFREAHRDALLARLPGLGRDSGTFVEDAVADERLVYYLGINNVLGLIGAFGSQHLADEELLLAALRRFLTDEARPADGRNSSSLPGLLLGSPTLRCKANLLTRVCGLDELVGPVDGQSVYVTIANPLVTS
ncbi:IucA/IucC family protein [Streptomyces sodiiphilus]|uniref:IucA/IucC family protein n=1 Tax=Streptomyces sodiiphilus TaxID=226217 RepID=A0ABN2PJH9_9ACTN